jgi:DNA-binding transcriptional LysR family regulator
VDRLDAFQTYVRVVESGSFSAAARELGVGQSAVSKQIAALEAQLGAELLWRSSRTISVTEVGKDFYESCIRLPTREPRFVAELRFQPGEHFRLLQRNQRRTGRPEIHDALFDRGYNLASQNYSWTKAPPGLKLATQVRN